MDIKYHNQQILSKYLPGNSIALITDWISKYNFNLKITRKRVTKFGDYHYPSNKVGHRISINNDLNKYAFLITLVHEIAHLIIWEKYKKKVKPHGNEWKNEYRALMKNFIVHSIFPSDILEAINAYMVNPYASSASDIGLMRTLRKYDDNKSLTYIEDIPRGSVFRIKSGRTFCKGEKLRKRYKCEDLYNKKIYLFNPLTDVTPVRT
ncbi:MAG: SprT-like domain-containing protein [Bacteroidota bacterium]